VWKEDTRAGEPFELGKRRVQRNSKPDWDAIWTSAAKGNITDIPADIRLRCYANIRKVEGDHARPIPRDTNVVVYWGASGTGKSRRAWDEGGLDAYPKDPRSKFWEGYAGQETVILDEFRGGIDVAHILRWFDRYPCMVEIKGSAKPLRASRFLVTSNLHPDQWYPELDPATLLALKRRMEITEMK